MPNDECISVRFPPRTPSFNYFSILEKTNGLKIYEQGNKSSKSQQLWTRAPRHTWVGNNRGFDSYTFATLIDTQNDLLIAGKVGGKSNKNSLTRSSQSKVNVSLSIESLDVYRVRAIQLRDRASFHSFMMLMKPDASAARSPPDLKCKCNLMEH